MNKQQKEVLQSQLNNEAKTIKELKQVYQQALEDVSGKVNMLSLREDLEPENISSIIYQQQYQQTIKAQIEGVLEQLHSNEFATISEYLNKSYTEGFLGTMYDLSGQGLPFILPIDQKAVVNAIQIDSKLSKPLYSKLGEDVNKLKTSVRAEISRGIVNGASWHEIASQMSKSFKNTPLNTAYNNAIRITRTEAHRIQIQAADDAQHKAAQKGAEIVKQWDATMDGNTRESHRMVDGEIRELNERFSNGLMYPSDPSGSASEVVNCRCALLQRAKWALDEAELDTLQKKAEYFGIDKTENFEDYQKKYLKLSKGLGSDSKASFNIPEHKVPEILGNIDFNNDDEVDKTFAEFESNAINETIETACIILKDGTIYKCYGVSDRVFPDIDLGDKLIGAKVSHNHPIEETSYSFSKDDLTLFMKYDLVSLRGCDEKYTYIFTRNANEIDEQPIDWMNFENFQHGSIITLAENYGIGYRRWLNE